LAHELQEASEKIRGSKSFEPVKGEKDEVDGVQGKPVYQEVNYAKLSAVVWSALKDVIGKVEKLEERVTQLEDAKK
jgi:hypothetical protein